MCYFVRVGKEWGKNQIAGTLQKTTMELEKGPLEKEKHLSGQIIIFHQPRFSLTKPPFGSIWGEVVWGRYNLTRSMNHQFFGFQPLVFGGVNAWFPVGFWTLKVFLRTLGGCCIPIPRVHGGLTESTQKQIESGLGRSKWFLAGGFNPFEKY